MLAAVARDCTLVMLLACAGARGASAQDVLPGPPGPFVIDVRGTTMGMPQAFGFYPEISPDTLVPARGFGIEAGGHVYVGQPLGPARLGIGAAFVQARGTSPGDVAITTRVIAPQVSFNFGTSKGWSYVSGGMGIGDVRGEAPVGAERALASRESGWQRALNVGGGARWLFARHVAITFDLRLHRLAARAAGDGVPGTPAVTLGAASVGLSFK